MRKRVWKIQPDAYHSPGLHGVHTLMVGNVTQVRFIWKGEPANIHATAILGRQMIWNMTRVWIRRKWRDGNISMWILRVGVYSMWMFLVFALLVVARHEGMI